MEKGALNQTQELNQKIKINTHIWTIHFIKKEKGVIFQSKGSNPESRYKHVSLVSYPEKEVTVES